MAEYAGVLGRNSSATRLRLPIFPQRAPRVSQRRLPRGRERRQALALAHEYAQAELVLELPHLLADAGLRREKRLGCLRDIEAVVDHRAEVLELLQVHAVYNRATGKGLII
jgi:hypothetical protein